MQDSDQTHREWIYRQAFHMGRHIIGYEVQTVLAAVDWFATQPADHKVGVCGQVEGGLVAFHAAAVDPRIDATLVSGYFDSRQQVWAEPIYRNVWSRLREFGDAELAGLIVPRELVIEHSAVPEVSGHKGALRTPDFASVNAEVRRIATGTQFRRPVFVHGEAGNTIGPFSEQAVTAFFRELNVQELASLSADPPADRRESFDPGVRHLRLVAEMENHVQVKATLFSFIIAQHDQILRWLATQPFVDERRIAFYGLSYGGETAVRVPTILQAYCLSICSGDFNQWTRKVAATDQPFSFMRTIEWEMPYWNLGHTFDYAEMAYLMLPRPFMVERGHLDRVGRDSWVAHEYAKVRWLYAQLDLADQTKIEFFQGGHSMRGDGTFDFLHQHLNWPKVAN